MANEATLYRQSSIPVQFTVADGTGIEKGTVLKMTDPNTAAKSDGDVDVVAGVAYTEKIANDGVTSLAVIRGPGDVVRMKLSGSATAGDAAVTHSSSGGDNVVATASINDENILGNFLETGAEGETVLVELNPRGINLA